MKSLRAISSNPIILPVYAPSLIFAFCQGLLIPILPLYARAFGASYALIGLVLAGEGLGMLVGDVPAGVLLRRLGTKRTMMLGLGGAALMTTALFWANSIPEVFLYRFLTGFSVALFNISRHAYLTSTVNLGNRGRTIAVYGGINRIGRFASPAIGGFMAAIYGIRGPFLFYGAACLVAIILVAIFVAAKETNLNEKIYTAKGHFHHLAAMLKAHYHILTTAGAGQLFAQAVRAGRIIIIPLFGADVLGLSVQEIGVILSISAAIDMSLFYPTGLIMDRRGRKYAIVPCFLIQAIGLALVPFTWGFFSLLLVSCLIGFGNGLGSGTMMTLGSDLAPADSRGEFLGVWRFIGDVGATGAPLVVGTVAEVLMLQTAIWVISGAGFVSVLIFAFWVPETLKKPREYAAEPA